METKVNKKNAPIDYSAPKFDPKQTYLNENESWETIDGQLFLKGLNQKGEEIRRKVKWYPKVGRCSAMTKVGYCWNYPVSGLKACRFHGGANGGIKNNLFVTGTTSNHVPSKIADIYDELKEQNDSSAKDLRKEIDLVNSFINYYLEQMEESLDIAEIWIELSKLIGKANSALKQENYNKIQVTLDDMKTLIKPAVRSARAENAVVAMIETKMKLVDRDASVSLKKAKKGHLYDGQIIISLFYTLLQKLTEFMIAHSVSSEVRKAILLDISKFSGTAEFSGILGENPIIDNDQ